MLDNNSKNILKYCIELEKELEKTISIYKNIDVNISEIDLKSKINTLENENKRLINQINEKTLQLKKVRKDLLIIKNEIENGRNISK